MHVPKAKDIVHVEREQRLLAHGNTQHESICKDIGEDADCGLRVYGFSAQVLKSRACRSSVETIFFKKIRNYLIYYHDKI